MRYSVHIEERFEAAHRLVGHPKCGELHGHSYRVEVELSGYKLDGSGMLIDFGTLKPAVREVIHQLDHTFLNLVLEQPTAESVCQYFWERLLDFPVTLVRVWETATAYAEMGPSLSLEWLAGFLEGDGCFSYDMYKTPQGRCSVRPMILFTQKELAPLERIRDGLHELGIAARLTVTGGARTNLCRVTGYDSCRRLVRRLGGLFLGEKRQEQFEMLVSVFELGESTGRVGRFTSDSWEGVREKLRAAGWHKVKVGDSGRLEEMEDK